MSKGNYICVQGRSIIETAGEGRIAEQEQLERNIFLEELVAEIEI